MLTKTMFLLIAIITFLSLPTATLAFQQIDNNEVIKTKTELVTVDAQVLNKKTMTAFSGLNKDHFLVYEDGVQQTIESLTQEQLPLSVLLLVDLTVKYDLVREVREGAVKALTQLKETDEVAIMAFTSTSIATPFTRNKETAIELLDQTIAEAPQIGFVYNSYDAIFDAAHYMKQAASPAGRRVVIMITPGVASMCTKPVHSQKEIENELLESGAMFSALTVKAKIDNIPTAFRADQNPTKVKYGSNIKVNNGMPAGFEIFQPSLEMPMNLDAYSDLTAGLVINARNRVFDETFMELINNLRTAYTISYISSNPVGKKNYHQIKVKLAKDSDNLIVKARKGYYSE